MIPALLSNERDLQITALVEELADNSHNVASVHRTADEGAVIDGKVRRLKMHPNLDVSHARGIEHAFGKGRANSVLSWPFTPITIAHTNDLNRLETR
ncbi:MULTISPECIES: hypothetical protein [Serratia]|uniref:hypothetical protein n=1 Tax=Serratia TaxID=613 RepID=UPI00059B5E7C|nr:MULTISPECIES: hypothetical protein [Serratia]UTN95857.1 hypothetical protein NLX81_20725 [Serratia plymuthica]